MGISSRARKPRKKNGAHRATGERMRSARERLGKSQLDIANEVGRTQPTIHAWEAGRAHPRTAELRRAARAYGLEIDQLVPDEAAA